MGDSFVQVQDDRAEVGPEFFAQERHGCRTPGVEVIRGEVAIPTAVAAGGEMGAAGGQQQFAGDDLARLRINAHGGKP